MRLRPLRAAAGSLVLVALTLAHPGHGADSAESAEQRLSGASEPGLHRLLKRLVREAREHPHGAQSTRGAPHPGKRTPLDARCARQGPRHAERQTDDAASPPP